MTKVTVKALERAVADISKVSMITDYQGNVVPQYFDTALLQYVPITNTWGGGSGEGSDIDVASIESDLNQLKSVGTMLFAGDIVDYEIVKVDITEFLSISLCFKPSIDPARLMVDIQGRVSNGPTVNIYTNTNNQGWGFADPHGQLDEIYIEPAFPFDNVSEFNGIRWNNDMGLIYVNNITNNRSYEIKINGFNSITQKSFTISVSRYEKKGPGHGLSEEI